MPVVVTGADGPVGRALVPLLVARGSEVRAVVPRRDLTGSLRAAGAKAAVADPGDADTLRAVVRDAHTVCHLTGAMDGPVLDLRDGRAAVEGIVEAAVEAEIARFLLLSSIGADPGADAAYLRDRGLAEETVRASGIPSVIVRASFPYGEGTGWLRLVRDAASGWRGAVVGPGTQRLAPVLAADVAAVLAAADDRATPVTGTFDLGGPDVVTALRLAELVGGGSRRPRVARVPRGIPPLSAEVLALDAVPTGPNAGDEFGLHPTPLEEGLGIALGLARWGGAR